MSDIAAISLMKDRKKHHSDIDIPTHIGKEFDDFQNVVFKATKASTDCLEKVNNYVIRIKTEMQDLRKCVEKFNIDLSEKMKMMVASVTDDSNSEEVPQHVRVYSPSMNTGKPRSTSRMKQIDKDKLNQLSELQKLSQQQQELMQLITQTTGLIIEIEEEGHVSLERMMDLKQGIDGWAKYLNKDEDEKKRKEKERKEREEQRKKQEEEEKEKKQRDWKNWPTIIYERIDGKDSHDRGISCIISVFQGNKTVKKEDLNCTVSDNDQYKKKFLNQKECPVSSVVTIEAKSMLKLEMPARIFIPHMKVPGRRDLIIKVKVNGGTVRSQDTINDLPNTYLQGTTVVGFAVNNFQSLEILVVSRPQIQNFMIGKSGGTITSTGEEKTTINFKSDCFDSTASCSLQVADKRQMRKITKDIKDLQNVRLAVQPHNISLDQNNQSEIRMQTYPDLKQIINRPQSSAKAFEKEFRNINGDTILSLAERLYKNGIIGLTALNDIKAKRNDEYKAKRLADEICFMDEDEFESLIHSLKSFKDTNLPRMLEKVYKENKDNNCGSDFLGGLKEEEMKIVSCKDRIEWTVTDVNKVTEEADSVYISLPKGGRHFSVMGLIVPKSTTAQEIMRLAELVFVSSEQFMTRLLVKQHSDDKQRLMIRCASPELLPSVNAELKHRGFTGGPEETFEFWVHEGEIIYLELIGNISFVSGNKKIQVVFYSNSVSGMEVNLCGITSKNDVWNNKFRAELRYNAGPSDQSPPRHGVFKLRLEQEGNEFKPMSKKYRHHEEKKKNTK